MRKVLSLVLADKENQKELSINSIGFVKQKIRGTLATPLPGTGQKYSEIGSECLTSCKCMPAPWKWVQPFIA